MFLSFSCSFFAIMSGEIILFIPFYVFSTLLLCPFMVCAVSLPRLTLTLFAPGIRQSVDFNHRTNPRLHNWQHPNLTSKDGGSLRLLSSGFIRLHVSLHIVSLRAVIQSPNSLHLLNPPPLGINKVNRTSSYLISSRIHGTPTGNTDLAANKELVP